MIDAFDPQQLAVLERQIDEWLAALHHDHEHVVAIDRATDGPIRWYVRMRGDEKEFTTVWVTLGQRTLRYETYVLPAPEENAVELYENLLRRNERLVGAHFSIGIEDAVFLRGEMPVGQVTHRTGRLHRVLGPLCRRNRTVLPVTAAHRLPQPLHVLTIPSRTVRCPLPGVRMGVLGESVFLTLIRATIGKRLRDGHQPGDDDNGTPPSPSN